MDNIEVEGVVSFEEALRDDDIGQQATEALSSLTNLVLKKASSLAFETQLSRYGVGEGRDEFF